VLGVVAALTLAAGIDDAAGNPARYGQVHQLDATLGYDGDDIVAGDVVLPVLTADPDVAAVNDSRSAVAEVAGGTLLVYSFDPVGTPMGVVVTAGRLPVQRDEIAMAPYRASTIGVGVGDTIALTGNRSTAEFTVTGIAFVPEGPENYNVDGGWVTATGYDDLFDTFAYHVAHVAIRDGADPRTIRVSPLWRDPGVRSEAQAADSAVKLHAEGLLSREGALRRLGLSPAEIEAERRRGAADAAMRLAVGG
jgi:hypothetical protein